LILSVVELYRTNEQQAHLTTHLTLEPRIRVDVSRMRQLLVNLLKNALEAMAEQGQGGEIRVATQLVMVNNQAYAELSIQDSGPGINPDLLSRLFDPYVTTKHKGTGLGLAIVKKIVEEHGGTINAHNHPQKGAIITVYLPIRTLNTRNV